MHVLSSLATVNKTCMCFEMFFILNLMRIVNVLLKNLFHAFLGKIEILCILIFTESEWSKIHMKCKFVT